MVWRGGASEILGGPRARELKRAATLLGSALLGSE